jgi:hypothetical protein
VGGGRRCGLFCAIHVRSVAGCGIALPGVTR